MVELTLSNPDAGTKAIYGLKGEDSTYMLGGYTNTNTMDGAKRLVSTKELTPGSIEVTVSNNMGDPVQPEFEFVQACANSLNETVATFATVNGIVYQGSGQIEGDLSMSGKDSKFTFKMLFGAGIQQQ